MDMFKQLKIIHRSLQWKNHLHLPILSCVLLIGGLLLPFVLLKTASVGANSEPIPLSKQAAVSVRPDMAVTKSHSGDVFTDPDGGVFTIEVENISDQAVTGPVTVTDNLPVRLLSDCPHSQPSMLFLHTCMLKDLAAGQILCLQESIFQIPRTWFSLYHLDWTRRSIECF